MRVFLSGEGWVVMLHHADRIHLETGKPLADGRGTGVRALLGLAGIRLWLLGSESCGSSESAQQANHSLWPLLTLST